MLSPSRCPNSEHPTFGVLLPTPPLKNYTQPERKGIAMAGKLSTAQGHMEKKEKGPGGDQIGVITTCPPRFAKSPAQLTK